MSLLKTGVFVPLCLSLRLSLAPRLRPTRALLLLPLGSSPARSRGTRGTVLDVCACGCACVRVRGQLLFTGAGKTIMEKYLWSTSVAHQQMIIKPGAPPNPAPPTVATAAAVAAVVVVVRFFSRARPRSLHYYYNSRSVCLRHLRDRPRKPGHHRVCARDCVCRSPSTGRKSVREPKFRERPSGRRNIVSRERSGGDDSDLN